MIPSSPLDGLVKTLSRLPGIGERSAMRLALFILRDTKGLLEELIRSLSLVREKVRFCRACQNLSEEELCAVCRDPKRDRGQICVIQDPVDLFAIERAGEYRGLYHVLHGALSPLDGVGPEEIRAERLLKRIHEGRIHEVILATNPNPEGEATALFLKRLLEPTGVKVTRIASGVPVGGVLEFTDPKTLARALGNRRDY